MPKQSLFRRSTYRTGTLVKTDDLARFYHYDAASFLITGNKIAHAYQEALEGVVECPDPDGENSSSSRSSESKPSKSKEPL